VAVVSVWDEIGLLYDKKFRIPPLVRLFVHACAALLAYSISGVGITNLVVPGIGDIPLATSSILVLTMGWYLLFINGINRLDGVY
jgi:hypothetical protein